MSRRYYGSHPDYAGEVDHAELLARLASYDGWALSTSSTALADVLALAPRSARVAAWHRGPRVTKHRMPLAAWEPVIYSPARTVAYGVSDSLEHGPGPRLTDPARVIGAKPAAFARWMFNLLGAAPGDSLDDLYPGSGGIRRAWAAYCEPSLAAASS